MWGKQNYLFKVKGYDHLINLSQLERIPGQHRSRQIKVVDTQTKCMTCMDYRTILKKFK